MSPVTMKVRRLRLAGTSEPDKRNKFYADAFPILRHPAGITIMAPRHAANRDQSSLSDQRAQQIGRCKLEIEVRETLRRLIVTMPGTRYAMEFAQIEDRLGLVSG